MYKSELTFNLRQSCVEVVNQYSKENKDHHDARTVAKNKNIDDSDRMIQ